MGEDGRGGGQEPFRADTQTGWVFLGGAELLGGSGGREQCLGLDFDFSQLRGRDAF
jgi:hypothetical protein